MPEPHISGDVVWQGAPKFGVGVVVSAGAHGRIRIGRGVHIKSGACLQAYNGYIEIEDRVSIGENCVIYGHGGVHFGKSCAIGPLCFIGSQEHILTDRIPLRYSGEKLLPTTIGESAIVSASCMISSGTRIGRGALIGAGSLVFDDIPAQCLAYGSPCRMIQPTLHNPLYGWRGKANSQDDAQDH